MAKLCRHPCPSCPINDTLYNGVLTTLWQQFGENHFPVSMQQYPLCIVPRTNVFSKNGVKELGRGPWPQPPQTPLNWGIVCKPSLIVKTSMPKPANALEAGNKKSLNPIWKTFPEERRLLQHHFWMRWPAITYGCNVHFPVLTLLANLRLENVLVSLNWSELTL